MGSDDDGDMVVLRALGVTGDMEVNEAMGATGLIG